VIDPISRLIHRGAGQHGPVVLMYHSIAAGNRRPNWPWAVSLRQFRNQLDFLAAEGWATPTVAELVRAPDRWTGRTAVITFDDGYVDNLAAADELIRRGMRATWYIVTGYIGRYPTWEREGQPTSRLLNTEELSQLLLAGMDVGAHTHNHRRLTELEEGEIVREIVTSRETLSDILGTPPPSFAYPYGAWNTHCEKAVKDVGFLSACTTRSGWALREGNPYRLRRLTVFNTDTVINLAHKLCFGTNDGSWRAVARYATRRFFSRKV